MSDGKDKPTRASGALPQQPAAFHIGHAGTALQPPFDAAIVMPTVLRPTLDQALRSVHEQDFDGTIHIVIGIDRSTESRDALVKICNRQPPNCLTTILDLGYSTSARHGGLHPAADGGSLRTALSYLANSRHLAYLDDDNWWAPDHLSSLRQALAQGADWAYGLRWFVETRTDRTLAVDRWESTGVGNGCYADAFGGFVDPNCLMIDKLACEPVLRCWSIPANNDHKAMSADRNVFNMLKSHFRGQPTGRATCYYRMNPDDGAHGYRLQWLREAGVTVE